jgi:hypothetical protein
MTDPFARAACSTVMFHLQNVPASAPDSAGALNLADFSERGQGYTELKEKIEQFKS